MSTHPVDVPEGYAWVKLNYLNAKGTEPEKQVGVIFSCFLDQKFTNWIRPANKRAEFLAMTLPDFMKAFHAKFLENDWVTIVRTEILRMRQKPGQSFDEYSTAVLGHCLLLADAAPITNLTPAWNDDLQFMCLRDDKLKTLVLDPALKLDDYIRAVIRIDEERKHSLDTLRRLANIADGNKENKRKGADDTNDCASKRQFKSKSAAPSSTASDDRNPYPPALTALERDLLAANEGCNKCRKPFAGHATHDCTTPMTRATYAPITDQTIADARCQRKGKAPAPVSSTTAGSSKPVAAIMPPAVSDSDKDNSDAEDDLSRSDVSTSLPRRIPHRIPSHPAEHLSWRCLIEGPNSTFALQINSLIDNGCHLVIIDDMLATKLGLQRFTLHEPEPVSLAIADSSSDSTTFLTEYVKLHVTSVDQSWTSTTVRALVTHGLCAPVIFGLPWLIKNQIVIDHSACTVTDKRCGYDLFNPPEPKALPVPKMKLKDKLKKTNGDYKLMMTELNAVCDARKTYLEKNNLFEDVKPVDVIAAVRERVEVLAHWDELNKKAEALKREYSTIFEPVPHVDLLPTDVYCEIKLKKADIQFQTRSYQSPRKYKEAWQTLIQGHLDAGRLRPSSSPHASPAFLIPKADKIVLPRWINDFRPLNAATERDSFPLRRVDDILADCAKGKIWSTIDFTNSFYQTRMHPDSIKYTAVSTLLGLYEWLVMPQGLRNVPSVQQRRVTAALRELIGRICHVYLDDIIIWSENAEEHEKHIRMVFDALRKASLYCNPKKTKLFQYEVDFLGHRISTRGVQADPKKVERIALWPQPTSATKVRGFLGLVHYLASFLPGLATHTEVLEKLTTKECDKNFPLWTNTHQTAFDEIKKIVLGADCLTTIDHENPGDNKIFVTCDASDRRSGAVLSWGPTWESARPVAFDSMSFKKAELNYPVHEKELLAIMRALHKWCVDLIGSSFIIYTDHRTLENFETQKDLSRRQARWMELLSQYDCKITYVKGEDNSVADALSRTDFDDIDPSPSDAPWLQDGDDDNAAPIASVIPLNADSPFASAQSLASTPISTPTLLSSLPIASVLKVTADAKILDSIRKGYASDPWCSKLSSASAGMPGLTYRDELWFIADRLIIPRVNNLREILFQLAHDNLGHFGFDKSYKALRDAYYWPNMRTDLEKAYIPGCPDCQRNKGRTAKRKAGPLHPLPIPDQRGDSVAIDFIGPLPIDQGFNCIVTFTCRLGSDVRIIPTTTKLTAPELAVLDHWYCDNGLPLDIISDRDKLFMSAFWKALHKLTGVKLKMSTAYHPQTDGASERTNKTVNQSLRYHVACNQKGWVPANGSIPPPDPTPSPELSDEEKLATEIIQQLTLDVAEAQDNLLTAKLTQAEQANKHRRPDHNLKVGDRVKLNTKNRRTHYKQKKNDGRCAKFMPRSDGPYSIVEIHPEFSTYTLDLENQPRIFPVFHASEIEPYVENNDEKFPSRKNSAPAPVLVNGIKEHFVDLIIDEQRVGRGFQYLVRYTGEGPEGDRWLPGRLLADNEALDRWLARSPD
ncbi:Reverse transcriptase-RNase H-integrase [Mycena venus]|uniref:RNA-directed DNA polymerase n=1 Tax=Mycena venus TaxID=2733690 RepID=A0A8H7CK44_9AGAR|nr:Reverse transcriptase-RNase H-integrase [Mycena venus]